MNGAVAALEPSKQRLRLWLRVLRSTRYMENQLRERLRQHFGATLPRFDVLAALYRERDGLTMGKLSHMLMVSNGNVTGIIDRLVDDGLVERIPIKGDRRAIHVRLTPQGLQQFENMASIHEGWVDELFSDISAEDAARIIDILANVQRKKN
jgi:DNA-binding MarR family transcriptional regulator